MDTRFSLDDPIMMHVCVAGGVVGFATGVQMAPLNWSESTLGLFLFSSTLLGGLAFYWIARLGSLWLKVNLVRAICFTWLGATIGMPVSALIALEVGWDSWYSLLPVFIGSIVGLVIGLNLKNKQTKNEPLN
jgi:hypothetical protein